MAACGIALTGGGNIVAIGFRLQMYGFFCYVVHFAPIFYIFLTYTAAMPWRRAVHKTGGGLCLWHPVPIYIYRKRRRPVDASDASAAASFLASCALASLAAVFRVFRFSYIREKGKGGGGILGIGCILGGIFTPKQARRKIGGLLFRICLNNFILIYINIYQLKKTNLELLKM